MSVPSSCPAREELELLVRGEVSAVVVERLARHVERCLLCLATLQTLEEHGKQAEFPRGKSGVWDGIEHEPLAGSIRKLESDSSLTPTAKPGTMPTPPPAPLGRYHPLEPIAAGGMGTVYKAHDPELDRLVAVKLPRFDPSSPQAGERKQRFLREARAAAKVRHPNVCPIYDVGEKDGQPYVVMAYLEGESLADWLKHWPGGVPANESVVIVLQALRSEEHTSELQSLRHLVC